MGERIKKKAASAAFFNYEFQITNYELNLIADEIDFLEFISISLIH